MRALSYASSHAEPQALSPKLNPNRVLGFRGLRTPVVTDQGLGFAFGVFEQPHSEL